MPALAGLGTVTPALASSQSRMCMPAGCADAKAAAAASSAACDRTTDDKRPTDSSSRHTVARLRGLITMMWRRVFEVEDCF